MKLKLPCLSTESVLFLVLCAAYPVGAVAETRQHGSHEHGAAVLNVAVAGATLAVEFIAPAANIVGFEHAPSSEEQERAVHQALELLESGNVMTVPAEADCRLARAEVETEGAAHRDEHDADKEHEVHAKEEDGGREEHTEDEETHSEFHAEYEYQCQNITALSHIDVELFKYFPGNDDITVQVITPNGQSGTELTPDSTRLVLP